MGEASEVVIPLFGVLDVTGEVILMWVIALLLVLTSIFVTLASEGKARPVPEHGGNGSRKSGSLFYRYRREKEGAKVFLFSGFAVYLYHRRQLLRPHSGRWDDEVFQGAYGFAFGDAGTGRCDVCVFADCQHPCGRLQTLFQAFCHAHCGHAAALVLDEFIKPASLALRLFGNVFGEETVTEELYGLLPIGAPVIMMALSLLFCAIQAVVFTMLVSIYLEEAIEVEE